MILSLNDLKFVAKEMSIRDDTAFYRKFTPGTKIQKYFKAQAGGWKDRPKDIDGNPIYKIGEGVVVANCEIIIREGDIHILYGNLPAKQGLIVEIVLLKSGLCGWIDNPQELDVFARLECFDSWQEMKGYFRLSKVGAYKGRLILWKNIYYKPILQWCYTCGKKRPIHLMQECGNSWECKDKSCGGAK